jgi:hypothetical protein
MSEQIDAIRKSVAKLAADRIGLKGQYPYANPGAAGATSPSTSNADNWLGRPIMSAPVQSEDWQPLQVWDVTNTAQLGLFYFKEGIDTPGDTTKVVP